ncbi:hypothetical protein RclHR1_02150030 [Rhizophagus clarus]|uniref:RNA-dependent RNA polymerase n=1 Tax=Rhizophagus clarus TaxID=94130 RepID=A0A2Z6QSF7_9GLOM|nr:hypothetical protein RclHR1_02150030 [Rhizophagus clarus]GET03424.1 RNA-dependent RNA polymerase 1 [Rhizophagus clarus]
MKTLIRPSFNNDHITRRTINGGYIHNNRNINNIQQQDDRYSIKAESLEMGVYLQKDTFVSEIKYSQLVFFIIDYQKLNIKVEFGVDGKLYSLEFEFKNINGEIYVEQQRPYWSITIENKFPPRYSIRDDNKHSFKRMTRIQTLRKSNEPLQSHMSDNSEQLGKWVVFRITFNNQVNYNFHRFIKMIEKARNFNLISKFNKPLRILDGSNLIKYVERSNLHFDVLYMIECNLSFNYIHDYNLNEEFFSFLSNQPKGIVLYVLEKMFEEKNRIYDPLSYLRTDIMKRNNVSVKLDDIPYHCAMIRKVVVTPTTMYMLPPNMETSNRVIRNYEDKKDNFLRVHFSDEASKPIGSSSGNFNDTFNDALYNRIYYTLNNGIKIGNIHYEFLAFSSSQLRDHSCWFFASTKDLTANDIRRWMGDFSDIKTVAKYAARMGQCFSSTRAIQYVPVNDIKEIPDIIRNGYTFSDGIGKISFSLAQVIAKELDLKKIPSAFQFRMAGYKGLLCQSIYVRANQVQVRPSQHKFKSNHNVLEIIRCSSYLPSYLNRQAITLLSALGIPDNVFIQMKDQQVNELSKIFESEIITINVLQQNIDEYETSQSLVELVKAGFLRTKDPYVINLISLFRIKMLQDLKKKAKIRVGKGAFLLGVLDETKTLREDEVYCCISDPCNPSRRKVITGTCIVFRNPCFHPGDIRIVKAVNCKTLNNLMDVLVFPAVGYRDIPSQCSGGDLDGDDFTIIYDEHLIPSRAYEPMCYNSKKPKPVNHVTMNDIKSFFVNYIFSDQLGKIANAHLAKADSFSNGAFHGQCIRLAHLHSDAVDFPKTGISAIVPQELRAERFPDFMEKHDKPSYKSEKVLGILYRSIKEEDYERYTNLNFDSRLLYVEGYEKYLENAIILKRAYDADIKGVMNQFGIMTEFEVISGYIINTITKIDKKKPRDIVKSVMDAIIPIRKRYRKEFEEEFYDEGTKIISSTASVQMKSKAVAWYRITYKNYELKDEDMISFPWIVYDILCEIVKGSDTK